MSKGNNNNKPPGPRPQFPPVELHNGFFWDCDECGCENFIRAIMPSFSPEELASLKEIYPEVGAHSYVMCPDEVKCRQKLPNGKECGARFSCKMTSL